MRHLLVGCAIVLLATACGGDDGGETALTPPALLPVDAATATVGGTLQLTLAVDNPDGLALTFRYEGPDLPSLDSTADIGGTPAGGSFTWTPLVSHAGEHVFTFHIDSKRGSDSRSAVITVEPAAESAPVFVSPGAGTTLDLAEKACLNTAVEVSDADSASVTLSLGETNPDGCSLEQTGAKSGTIEWCPTPQQIDAALRWSIELVAGDGEHPETRKLFHVILRRKVKEGCEGQAPTVSFVSPEKGEEVTSAPGFSVAVDVADDNPIKDPPLLYYSFEAPANEDKPDLTQFDQALFTGSAPRFNARVPDPGLEPGEQRVVYVVVEATDNDDADGTACDHVVTSDIHRFVAVGAAETVKLDDCSPCEFDRECQSGICASAASGGVYCLPACNGACALGECSEVSTVSGAVAEACAPAETVCFEEAPCTNDDQEPNDTLDGATELQPARSGVICQDDLDVYWVDLLENEQLIVELSDFVQAEGDLALVDESGELLTSSATAAESEWFPWCSPISQRVYVVVLGYEGATNDYNLSAAIAADECCAPDPYEPNDDPNEGPLPPTLVDEDVVEARICPADEDWFLFEAQAGDQTEITLVFNHGDIDLDLELYDAVLTKIAYSDGIEDESVTLTLPRDDLYLIRVFGYAGDSGEYLLELLLTQGAE